MLWIITFPDTFAYRMHMNWVFKDLLRAAVSFQVILMFVFHLEASSCAEPVAKATLSRRASTPGQSLELLITVKDAQPPVTAIPECPDGLELRRFRKPQHLMQDNQDVWLLRFIIITKSAGDYEIPPIRVCDGKSSVLTKPLILHVTADGKPQPPDARELALATDIPLSLAREAVGNFTAPVQQKPAPSPAKNDARPLPEKVLSSIEHGLVWLWNYPGK